MFVTLTTFSSNLGAIVELGQHQRADLTVFRQCRIHHQVKYRRKDANTCIEAAILFSGHPYIGRHYRATLITQATCQLTVVGALLYMADYIYYGVKVKPILSLCIRNLSLCPFAFLVFLLFWGVFCLFVVCASVYFDFCLFFL